MESTQSYIDSLRALIGNDELSTATQQLSKLLKNSPKLDEAIVQSARLNDVTRQLRQGTIDLATANVTKNQIRTGLLALIREIEDQIQIPAIQQEVTGYMKTISGKNMVGGSITAGGNVSIGDQVHHYTESKTSRNLKVFLYVLVPVLAIAAAVFYYQFRVNQQPLMLTVFLENQTPNPNLPFEKGIVSLKYGGKADTQGIQKEAIFKELPSKFKAEPVQVHFEAEGFESIDTTILLDQERLILPIRRDNSLANLFGTVREEINGQLIPLAEVEVRVQDLKTKTDEQGNFSMQIPFGKQLEQQRLMASKPGYIPFDRREPIIKNEPTQIKLQKIQ